MLVALRACVPLKMTPSIRSVRRLLALCSPTTQLIASLMLLFPQPFGPTIPVTPSLKTISVRSQNDLNPRISSFWIPCIVVTDPSGARARRAASLVVRRRLRQVQDKEIRDLPVVVLQLLAAHEAKPGGAERHHLLLLV